MFAYLPPPQELFEESLRKGSLKTAGGYLLILHSFEELSSSTSDQLVRLLSRAKDEGDWELCKELARFLTALDESGEALMEALQLVDLKTPRDERGNGSFLFEGTKLKVPRLSGSASNNNNDDGYSDEDGRISSGSRSSANNGSDDYFSQGER